MNIDQETGETLKLKLRNFNREHIVALEGGDQNTKDYQLEIEMNAEEREFTTNVFELFERMRVTYLVTGDEIKKADVILYFLYRPNLFSIFDISPSDFIEEVLDYESATINYLYCNELVQLLELPRNRIDPLSVTRFSNNNPLPPRSDFFVYFYFLEESDFDFLKEKFDNFFKKEEEKTVVDFIEFIHKDWRNFDIVNKPAYYIQPVNRIITLSHILLILRTEMKEGINHKENLRKFDFFKNFIKNFSLPTNEKARSISELAFLPILKKEEIIDIGYLDHIRKLFNQVKNEEGFVDKEDFLIKLRNDDILDEFMNKRVRQSQPNDDYELYNEILDRLIDRISEEAGDYMDWIELREYFSQRGFPMWFKKTSNEIQQTRLQNRQRL